MSLKEFIESNKNILYASICVADCSYMPKPSISCNVNKMLDGKYRLENPEITLEELIDINIEDVKGFNFKSFYDSKYGKCEYIVIEISEDTISNNSDKVLYQKLGKALNKDYKDLAKKYETLEKEYKKPFYSNYGVSFFKEIFVPFTIVVTIFAWKFANISENKEGIITAVTAITFLFIGTIILFIKSSLENKKEAEYCKEVKEEYTKKLSIVEGEI